jgi:type II secretory pathway pseudopilin PulG
MVAVRSHKNTHGTLLIELLIGIVVLCVLMTVMASWLHTMYTMRYDARQLSTAIASLRAIGEHADENVDATQEIKITTTVRNIPVSCQECMIAALPVVYVTATWQKAHGSQGTYTVLMYGETHA